MTPHLRAALTHFARGLLMGGADVIPGVSGGTMALIVGIYERLIDSISEGFGAVLALLRLDLDAVREHLRAVEWILVLPLGLGIAGAILVASTFMPYLLETYPAQMRGLFFGLIAGSLAIPWLRIGRMTGRLLLIALGAAVAAFFLVGLPTAGAFEPHLLQVFGAASVAICAMILPGISGAFLLLVMGLYEPTLRALNRGDAAYVLTFIAGAALGLGLFSKVLHWLLDRYHDATMAALVGLMAGSLRALWPWQTEGREMMLPEAGDPLASVLVLAALGLVFILALTWLSARRIEEQAEQQEQAREENLPVGR